MTCQTCDGTRTVCENHRDRPWNGGSGRDDACGCGPGVPCPVCVVPRDRARLYAWDNLGHAWLAEQEKNPDFMPSDMERAIREILEKK